MSDEWVMVPRKLAESQRNAMAMTHRHDYGIREEWERENIRKHMDQLHRAMLDAAPKPPVPETNFGNMLDCDIEPRPLDFPLRDYHHAIGEGPLHYTWTDKPHRLVYDLIAAVRYYAAPKPQEQAQPVEIVPRVWREALRKLTFMARTSGASAGPDEGLKAACAEAETLLSKPYNYPQQVEPVAWFDPTNKDPRQAVTFRKADQDEWPHIYSAPLYSHPDPQVQRLRDTLEVLIEAADTSDDCQYGTLGTSFVRDIARRALEGGE